VRAAALQREVYQRRLASALARDCEGISRHIGLSARAAFAGLAGAHDWMKLASISPSPSLFVVATHLRLIIHLVVGPLPTGVLLTLQRRIRDVGVGFGRRFKRAGRLGATAATARRHSRMRHRKYNRRMVGRHE
jgi:hypothetical protein